MENQQQAVDDAKKPRSPAGSPKHDKQPNPHTSDYAPYPKIDPSDVSPPSENWANVTSASPAPVETAAATTMPAESNPYVSPAPVGPSSSKSNFFYLVYGFLFDCNLVE